MDKGRDGWISVGWTDKCRDDGPLEMFIPSSFH